MKQCLFDEIVLFVLETVSSKEYLNELGIYRPATVNWNAFKKKVTKQTVEPGIYPRSFGSGSVHYYAVRNGMVKQVGNGYPSIDDLNEDYAIGMDAQEDHSHGLCQTYALMFYFFEEGRLKKGERNYFKNVLIGFEFLLEFITANRDERDRCWSAASMYENMHRVCEYEGHIDERIDHVNALARKGNICLVDLIKLILNKKHRNNLKVWFETDDDECCD